MGRTGTHSFKVALEQLLGGPCYHMVEVLQAPERATAWVDAANGKLPDWDEVFDGYVATVDWPAASFWPELVEAYPDAIGAAVDAGVVRRLVPERRPHDLRGDAARRRRASGARGRTEGRHEVIGRRFAPVDSDRDTLDRCLRAAQRRRARRHPGGPARRVATGRRLGAAVRHARRAEPDEPFPVTNTTDEFRAMLGLS